jgi:hypothetical protein
MLFKYYTFTKKYMEESYHGSWNSINELLTQKSYIVGVHRYAFRAGEPSEIIGLKWAKPEGLDWRLAYEVEYFDGKRDFVALQDVLAGNHVIISDVDLIEERIPPVTE